jgi:hypothetical protein
MAVIRHKIPQLNFLNKKWLIDNLLHVVPVNKID